MTVFLGILSAILAVAAAVHSDFAAAWVFILGGIFYVWCATVDSAFWEG